MDMGFLQVAEEQAALVGMANVVPEIAGAAGRQQFIKLTHTATTERASCYLELTTFL